MKKEIHYHNNIDFPKVRQTDIEGVYADGDIVHTTGNETIDGVKTFTSRPILRQGINFSDIGSEVTYSNELNFAGSNGEVAFTSQGAIVASNDITAFSDKRLKQDLRVIDNALDKVNSLTGYTYRRTDTGSKQTGLIAQDLLKVLPEAVHENEEGMLSVAYGNTVGLLVEAIKQLTEEVEELKRELGK